MNVLLSAHVKIIEENGEKYALYTKDGETVEKKWVPDGWTERKGINGIIEKLK